MDWGFFKIDGIVVSWRVYWARIEGKEKDFVLTENWGVQLSAVEL